MTTGTEQPRAVSAFEADLLRVLHYLLRHDPATDLLFATRPAPRGLSRAALGIVQDTLAKGCVGLLARGNGWRVERFLSGGRVVEGRLWQRHTVEELTLTFSAATLRTVLWLTAEDPAPGKARWPAAGEQTTGDLLFFYLTYGRLRETKVGAQLPRKAMFLNHAHVRLAYAEDFGKAKELPDFTTWLSGPQAWVLEALQEELTERWRQAEQAKRQLANWQPMQAVGQSQQRTLTAFLAAAEQADRRDLARFLFPVLADLLPEHPRLQWWTANLADPGPRLADRAATLEAALVLPRAFGTLQRWERAARQVRHFDENYAASQLYLTDWEHWHGKELAARAEALLRQAGPL